MELEQGQMERKNRGMGLASQLVSLVVLSAIIVMFLPNCLSWVMGNRVVGFSRDLAHAAHQARHLALTEGRRVTLCPLDTQGRCTRNWNGVLSTFFDDGARRALSSPDHLISILDVPPGIDLRWGGAGNKRAVHFNGSGLTSTTNGTFLVSASTSRIERRITINRQGRVRMKHGSE
ncbi:GspH/FimT family pseudopilin [Metapseudomonas otitidis]|uniref:GspH/FimT family pseudopilin n=1 Tax=Metapseudomonas otitidis TaxID=319939 RepID=UPI001CA38A38|nr:GspH/FimT family protein [Pseudomonas otitidis]QZX84138.1 GspH/FimT family protein [Pseudomonas otitidis]